MTRFNISIEEAVNFVIWALEKNIGEKYLYQSVQVIELKILLKQLIKIVKLR